MAVGRDLITGLRVVRVDARLHVVEIGRDEADALRAGESKISFSASMAVQAGMPVAS